MQEILDYMKQDIGLMIHILGIVFFTLIVYFIINRTGNNIVRKFEEVEDFDSTNAKFLQRILSSIIIMVGFGFIIFLVPSLKHIATTILAGAGVIVAIIGFSSQQVLANIISGIMIVTTKPYRIKDRVAVRDFEGIVEDITLRHTIIKNFENKRIIIPNSVMNNEVIINSNFTDDICCEWVEMGVAYTADIKHAKAVMKEEIIKHPLFIDHRNQRQKNRADDIAPVRVMSVGDFSITLRAWTWAANPGDAFILGCDLKEKIKERFEQEGIEIPYPYQNLILKKSVE